MTDTDNLQQSLFTEQELAKDMQTYWELRQSAKVLASQFDSTFDESTTGANWQFDSGDRRIRVSIEVTTIEDDEALRQSMFKCLGNTG